MQVQHIDMSVPVFQDAPDSEEDTLSEPSRADADLEALGQLLVRSVRQRGGFAWNEHGRALQREQFSREIKGIVKRLASTFAAVIKDRSNREEVRVQIYKDALAMINTLTMAHDVRQARSRLIRRWCWRIAGALVVIGTSAIGFILYR